VSNEDEGLDLLEDLDVEQPETAAYMAYNNAGGAGLVPYLTENSAERNTNVMNQETHDYPKELVTREAYREALQSAVRETRQRERRRILDSDRVIKCPKCGSDLVQCEVDGFDVECTECKDIWKLEEEVSEE